VSLQASELQLAAAQQAAVLAAAAAACWRLADVDILLELLTLPRLRANAQAVFERCAAAVHSASRPWSMVMERRRSHSALSSAVAAAAAAAAASAESSQGLQGRSAGGTAAAPSAGADQSAALSGSHSARSASGGLSPPRGDPVLATSGAPVPASLGSSRTPQAPLPQPALPPARSRRCRWPVCRGDPYDALLRGGGGACGAGGWRGRAAADILLDESEFSATLGLAEALAGSEEQPRARVCGHAVRRAVQDPRG